MNSFSCPIATIAASATEISPKPEAAETRCPPPRPSRIIHPSTSVNECAGQVASTAPNRSASLGIKNHPHLARRLCHQRQICPAHHNICAVPLRIRKRIGPNRNRRKRAGDFTQRPRHIPLRNMQAHRF